MYNLLYKIFRVSGRLMIKYSSDTRPASYPYVTGDGFRKIANYIYDNTIKNVEPKKIKEGDIIFIGDSNIERFLKEIHPHIKNKYVVISHNGDEVVNENYLEKAGDKIIKWYGINVTVKSNKVVPIPLGIENKHYFTLGIPVLFDNMRKRNRIKQNKIFYGFKVSNNEQERKPAFDVLENNKYAETLDKWLNMKKYLDLLTTYKFVASPPGSSVEGHRTWDALYLKIVPIVKKSITTEYFAKIGIPVWLVSDWRELNNINEEKLVHKFEELWSNFDESVLFMDYWTDKILNLKD